MKTSSNRTADTPLPYTRTEAGLPLTLLDRASARVRRHVTRRPLVVPSERLAGTAGDARIRGTVGAGDVGWTIRLRDVVSGLSVAVGGPVFW
jgi:hypothetical protein